MDVDPRSRAATTGRGQAWRGGLPGKREKAMTYQTAEIPELRALRASGQRIKRFVELHGERSVGIFARALGASFSEPGRFVNFLLNEPQSNEPIEACAILRRVGRSAAPLVPEIISTYYWGHWVDKCA